VDPRFDMACIFSEGIAIVILAVLTGYGNRDAEQSVSTDYFAGFPAVPMQGRDHEFDP
jgi:hypothetical protein